MLFTLIEEFFAQINGEIDGPVIGTLRDSRLLAANNHCGRRLFVPCLFFDTLHRTIGVFLECIQGISIGADLPNILHIAGLQEVIDSSTKICKRRGESCNCVLVHCFGNNGGGYVLRGRFRRSGLVLSGGFVLL